LRPVLAAVSRSLGNAVIDDIPEPGAPLAGRAVMRPEAARIRGSGCTIIPAIPAHCRLPGIIAREFRAMSSPPSAPNKARPRHRRSRPECPPPGMPSAGNARRGCENASTPPRARRPAATTRAPHAPPVAQAGADHGARRRSRAAPRAGEQHAISENG
jgi:hypothetical protein